MLEIIEHGETILEIRIARPPYNLMDTVTLRALRSVLAEIDREGVVEGIILSGLPGSFSAGIDVVSLSAADPSETRTFCEEIFSLASVMSQIRIPVVAAITGHCVASGVLLALFSDYRVMAEGGWRVALNEVKAGVALPEGFLFALSRIVGAFQAERMLVFGQTLTPKQSQAIGLVDELVPFDEVIQVALTRLQELLALPKHSMLKAREIARRDLMDKFQQPDPYQIEALCEGFLHPITQGILNHLAGDLKAKA